MHLGAPDVTKGINELGIHSELESQGKGIIGQGDTRYRLDPIEGAFSKQVVSEGHIRLKTPTRMYDKRISSINGVLETSIANGCESLAPSFFGDKLFLPGRGGRTRQMGCEIRTKV